MMLILQRLPSVKTRYRKGTSVVDLQVCYDVNFDCRHCFFETMKASFGAFVIILMAHRCDRSRGGENDFQGFLSERTTHCEWICIFGICLVLREVEGSETPQQFWSSTNGKPTARSVSKKIPTGSSSLRFAVATKAAFRQRK